MNNSTNSSLFNSYCGTIFDSLSTQIFSGNCNCACSFDKSLILGGYKNTIRDTGGYRESAGIITSNCSFICDSNLSSIIGSFKGRIYCQSETAIILGGNDTKLKYTSYSSVVGGACNIITNWISPQSYSCRSKGVAIVGGYKNCIRGGYYSSIITGKDNFLDGSSNFSSIISGCNNQITSSTSSVIIGGTNLELSGQTDVVLVPKITTATISNAQLALWKLGTTQSSLAPTLSSQYVEVSINGVVVKLAVIQ